MPRNRFSGATQVIRRSICFRAERATAISSTIRIAGLMQIDVDLAQGDEFLTVLDGEADGVCRATGGGEPVTSVVGGGMRLPSGVTGPWDFYRCAGRRVVWLGWTWCCSWAGGSHCGHKSNLRN